MSRRITLMVTDELAERIARVADYYDKDVRTFITEMVDDHTELLEEYHNDLACAQIRFLVDVEPAGSA